ncbi:MAG: hypothetical protein Q7T57_08660, partial [Dehalococcoidales bacterium]|nr:hypothetical protein [Dehalococcoidales bacterium]
QFTDAVDSVTIVVTTDIPCHLYCRLTSTEPQIHTASTLRRGVAFMSELKFCFVSYEDNEQTEAGDTLIHTWVKPAWGFCVTKWCYFWGLVGGLVSPSTSPFFKFHNDYIAPPPVEVVRKVAAWTDDFTRSYVPASWWSLNSPSFAAGFNTLDIKGQGSAARFLNITIPAGKIIVSAYLILTAEGAYNNDTVNTRLRAEKKINPLTFSTPGDFDARAWTTAYINWDAIAHWALNVEYTSPNIKTLIQEVIGLPGWVNGNPIVILWDDFQQRSSQADAKIRAGYSYDGSWTKAPELRITYQP